MYFMSYNKMWKHYEIVLILISGKKTLTLKEEEVLKC